MYIKTNDVLIYRGVITLDYWLQPEAVILTENKRAENSMNAHKLAYYKNRLDYQTKSHKLFMPHFQKHCSWDVQEATGNLITAEASRQQAEEKHGSSVQPYISYALQGCIYLIKMTVKTILLWNIITI